MFPLDKFEEEIYNVLYSQSGASGISHVREHGLPALSATPVSVFGQNIDSQAESSFSQRNPESSARTPAPHSNRFSPLNMNTPQRLTYGSSSNRSPQTGSSYHTAVETPFETPSPGAVTPRTSRSRSPHHRGSLGRPSSNARKNLSNAFFDALPTAPGRLNTNRDKYSEATTSQTDKPKLTARDIDAYMGRNEVRYERVLDYLAQIAQSSTEIANAVAIVSKNYALREVNNNLT